MTEATLLANVETTRSAYEAAVEQLARWRLSNAEGPRPSVYERPDRPFVLSDDE